MIDYFIRLEDEFPYLDFSRSEVSEIEFYTMVDRLLKEIKSKIYKLKQINPLYKTDMDEIVKSVESILIYVQDKIQELEEEEILEVV
jgi:hypothetical protein